MLPRDSAAAPSSFEVSLTLATFAVPMLLFACLHMSSIGLSSSHSMEHCYCFWPWWWLVLTWRRAGRGPQGVRGQTLDLRPLLPHRVKCPPEGLQTQQSSGTSEANFPHDGIAMRRTVVVKWRNLWHEFIWQQVVALYNSQLTFCVDIASSSSWLDKANLQGNKAWLKM